MFILLVCAYIPEYICHSQIHGGRKNTQHEDDASSSGKASEKIERFVNHAADDLRSELYVELSNFWSTA